MALIDDTDGGALSRRVTKELAVCRYWGPQSDRQLQADVWQEKRPEGFGRPDH